MSPSRVRGWSPALVGWLLAMGCLVAGFALNANAPDFGRGGDAPAIVLALSSSTVGAFILVRRPGHGIGRVCLAAGMLVSLGLLAAGIAVSMAFAGSANASVYWFVLSLAAILPLLAYVLIGPVLLAMYPTGAFTPTGRKLMRLALAIAVPLALITVVGSRLITFGELSSRNPLLLPIVPSGLPDLAGAAFTVGYVLGITLATASLVIRYRTAGQLERLQIRWVALDGFAIVGLIGLILANPAGVGDRAWWGLLILPAFMPVTVGVAIMRYRLYDIDRIISNAIGYGVVTVVLFTVFAVVNLALVSQVSPLVNNEGVAVAASTLLVAALFNPLRTRVQRAVDRRFHRARYDADRMVADFSGRLRDELDLPTLALELATTSRMAVEPSSSVVWLRGDGRR